MMKFLTIILLILCHQLVQAQKDELTYASVFYKNHWRMIDRNGEFILDQKYGVRMHDYLCFEENLAINIKDGKAGFTDFDNHQIIPNAYDQARCFQYGYAAVLIGDKWGMINKKNEFIVTPKYDFIGSFGPEGLAGVLHNNKLGFVDTLGQVVIPFKYDWFPSYNVYPQYPFFSDGLIAVVKDGKAGFINTKGELVIDAQYEKGTFMTGLPLFSNGRADVVKEGKPMLIDTTGNELPASHDPRYVGYTDGYAVMKNEFGKIGLMEVNGREIGYPLYDIIYPFSGNYARVGFKSDEEISKYGFINRKGEYAFDNTFKGARDFSEGLAAVEMNGKWGYINQRGKLIIDYKFDSAKDFNEGLAVVSIKQEKTRLYGFINKKGKYVIKPAYEYAKSFNEGLAAVQIGHKYGYINKKGIMVIKPKFKNARSFIKTPLSY